MKQLLNFEDTRIAFGLKSDWQLKKAVLLFKVIGYEWLTRIAKPVTNGFLKLRLPITPILKRTIFEHFCGGESIQDCSSVVEALHSEGNVCSILDYSVEGKESEAQFDHTVAITVSACDFAERTKAIPFLVFKATGVGRFDLFEKASKEEQLTPEEAEEWESVIQRFHTICKCAESTDNIKVMIDAEESWIQPAIDRLAETMMITYNTQRTVVFNTIQLYRWDRLVYLEKLKELGSNKGITVGVKLVRGAYMEKERARAAQLQYPSPICKDKKATDINFDEGLTYCIENISRFELFLGTHNEASSLLLPKLMQDLEIDTNDSRIWFGQLFGMSDHISFNLAKERYNTAKYLPFGPVRDVIPYLFRRADENTSVGTQTSRELFLLKKEVARRKKEK